jgi:RimJ/RimL family protein N-acetyltransferase
LQAFARRERNARRVSLDVEDADFDSIQSSRLTIRRFREADAEAFAAYRDDPEVARYQGWDRPYTVSQAREFVSGLRDLHPGRAGTWFQFAVCSRGSSTLLGDVGLRTTDEDPPRGELGFTFASAHQGCGYAREAVQEIIRYAVATLGMRRIFATTDAPNAPSRKLLTHLGFRLVRELEGGVCVYDQVFPETRG